MKYTLGLIGFPIKHSLSPWIHERFLKKANLNGSYSIWEINSNDSFTEKIEVLKKRQVNGFNVTVPYKQKIIPYLDELDPAANRIGAVNTVVYQNGKWKGYNTDGVGYVRSLEHKFPEACSSKNNRILIVGAGGAARGIYDALAQNGFRQIDIANRTAVNAYEIAKLGITSTKTNVLNLEEAQKSIPGYDIVIQTTSVGMKPKQNSVVLSLDHVKETSIVSDIVYQPIRTKFLNQAEVNGAFIHYGHTMLLYQAQYAFEIWTNSLVSIDHMDDELQLILEGR
ncbi:shikimate dehydrogenase [Virgibacillus byunsanensis]|uniref:Shikimate dehydrogenase (NADP(+)) n=1 Tax=Virgibacillus byunsanensis TaxID=570945 RepID=A0ABW3LJK5_9BACI